VKLASKSRLNLQNRLFDPIYYFASA